MRKSRWSSWAPDPNSSYGLCGRKATLNLNNVEYQSWSSTAHGYHLELKWSELRLSDMHRRLLHDRLPVECLYGHLYKRDGPFSFTSTEARWLIRDGDRGGRGRKSEGSTADTVRKRLERPWTAARTMEVLRRCPLAIAQRLVH